MRRRGLALASVSLLLFLATVLLALISWGADFSIRKSAFTEQYAKLEVARKIGLEAGTDWILKAAHRGYAPRAECSSLSSKTPLDRIEARFADGGKADRIRLFGDVVVDVYVADLDYPPESFGKNGSNIPRMPVAAGLADVGWAYLVRSEARDKFSENLCAEELIVVSFDLFGAVTGVRKVFYRNW